MADPLGGSGGETLSKSIAYVLQVQAENAIQELNKFLNGVASATEKIEKMRQITIQYAKDAGISFEQARRDILALNEAFAGTTKAFETKGAAAAIKEVTAETKNSSSAMKDATTSATGFNGMLQSLGKSASIVATALGIGLYQVLRGIIQYFVDATKAALDFNQSLFELEVGVRAAQKSGLDITIEQYKKEITDLQKQYPTLSTAEVTKGYAQILLLARDLGFTAEQIRQIADVSATAAVVMNKDFGETAIGITKSLSSGWFEAAQRAGFLISRQSVVNEGLRLNIENAKSGYNAMTEQERAEAALSVYVRENAKIQGDAGAVIKTNVGKVEALTAAWKNFTVQLGTYAVPALAGLATLLNQILTPAQEQQQKSFISRWFNVADGINAAAKALAIFLATMGTLVEFASKLKENGIFGGPKTLAEFDMKGTFDKWFRQASSFMGVSGNIEILGNMTELGTEMGNATGDGMNKALQDAWDKFKKLLRDEQADTANKIEQMTVDLNRKLADLDEKYQTDRARKIQDYNNNVADAQLSINNQIADANANYRENQLKAEEDYQKRLHELRDKYLLDLEDALRKRDASQVIRLMKQYQMERDNITSDKKTQDAQAARDHEKEIARIRREGAERLAQMARDHAIQMKRLQEDHLAAEAEAKKRYQQELDDLATQSKNRLQVLMDSLLAEGSITAEEYAKMQALAQQYLNNLGTMYSAYARGVINIINSVKAALSTLNALPITQPGSKEGYSNYPSTKWNTYQQQYGTQYGHAKGGIFHADKPTPAIFGEAGGETAIFIPDSQMTRNLSTSRITNVSNTQNINIAGAGGEMKVWVMLDQDLIGRIENNTIGKVAGVVNQVRRERR